MCPLSCSMHRARKLSLLPPLAYLRPAPIAHQPPSPGTLCCPTSPAPSPRHALQLDATSEQEDADLARCRARLQHLRDLGPPPRAGQVEWNRRRIDALLVDHLLRAGHNRAAAGLAASAGIQVCRGGEQGGRWVVARFRMG